MLLNMGNHLFKSCLIAIRPKTLPAAIAPVAMGTAMAYGDGVHDFPVAWNCLGVALLLQIGTNLANDYFDHKKGADTAERVGPVRVTQSGLVPPLAVLAAALLCFVLTAYFSVDLIQRGGQTMLFLAIASILSGLLYTAGPFPFGYLGLGEIFVLFFFGVVAVTGTYYVQSLEINAAIIVAGLGPGLLSAAILSVNNLRDIEGDRKANKRTLAVRFGKVFAHYEYLFCVIMASLIPIVIYLMINDRSYILIASFTALIAIPIVRTVLTQEDGPTLNKALAATGGLLLVYSILFSIGWIL